ncbi:hypothetical protein K490DRAFT_68661 [Saccharata proteae CBS 121410]|uniref:Uncharacterized protein n=1 Tax=Saccharata proteae CBS 121410 TaxID=1314787 RepID=A0A9P4LU70_9PEZI|nr:hypothetical protein K490DRAFT_68661 [Saccharata proteae CBS 121410]
MPPDFRNRCKKAIEKMSPFFGRTHKRMKMMTALNASRRHEIHSLESEAGPRATESPDKQNTEPVRTTGEDATTTNLPAIPERDEAARSPGSDNNYGTEISRAMQDLVRYVGDLREIEGERMAIDEVLRLARVFWGNKRAFEVHIDRNVRRRASSDAVNPGRTIYTAVLYRHVSQDDIEREQQLSRKRPGAVMESSWYVTRLEAIEKLWSRLQVEF